MLLKISSTAPQATDLGFLLHKNPANLHEIEMPFGKAFVFYTEASPERCTACLLLEIDPVSLVRGAQQSEDYVNDRPYARPPTLLLPSAAYSARRSRAIARSALNWSVRSYRSKPW